MATPALESGSLPSPELLRQARRLEIRARRGSLASAGADVVENCTGGSYAAPLISHFLARTRRL